MMEEAAKRNPQIQLSGLEWGVPGWVAASPGGGGRYGGMWSPANVDYMVGWATGLRDRKGLNVTALAVAYNERGYNATFIKAVRKSLDAAGLAHVQTIAADASGSNMFQIVADMAADAELAEAIARRTFAEHFPSSNYRSNALQCTAIAGSPDPHPC